MTSFPVPDPKTALDAGRLRRVCDPSLFQFATTEELEPLDDLIGQDRALDAIRFGTGMARQGYNLFVLGTPRSGRHSAIRAFLNARAPGEAPSDDWVYVHNFDVDHKPRAIRLPAGTAIRFRDAMEALVDELRVGLPSMFESDDYRSRRQAIQDGFEQAHQAAFDDLQTKAQADNVAILKTPMGFALAPVENGQVIKPEAFNTLPEAERNTIEAKINELQPELQAVLQNLPNLERDRRRQVQELDAELAEMAVAAAISDVDSTFADFPEIQTYLGIVRADLIRHANVFLQHASAENEGNSFGSPEHIHDDPRIKRYAVNAIVANAADGSGAPVVFEANPTLSNLVGRIEHISQMGTLLTDFTLIKAGALHQANGGYLVLDARKVITEPFAWEALKRSLRSGTIEITSAAEQMSLVSTTSINPDPIPLKVKVILVGERMEYYMLSSLDPEFQELFKVEVDFDDELERTDENLRLYGQMVGTLARREGLRAIAADGVARLVDAATRITSDCERLTLRIGPLVDLLSEADFYAQERASEHIFAEDIARASAEQIRRADRIREASHEGITRETILIDTTGKAVGQINGLSVLSVGNYAFGQPTRITARVRMGSGTVVDIEREAKLGGALHSKGVLILSAFLSSHFALDAPVSLWASIVFEQSYGGVDGDSASSAELYALLSALADVAIRQDLAVTGSVNQLGQVQAIGGVNEKIEGFFDICSARGLTGDQGVLIPASNVKHLMLREDVVAAADDGRFHIYPIETIDEGIEVLTGVGAGQRDEDGQFPDGSINGLVEARLYDFARKRQSFGKDNANDKDNDKDQADSGGHEDD